MTFKLLAVTTATMAFAVAGCDKNGADANSTTPETSKEASKAAGDQTIAAGLDQNGKFTQAAKAAGLDATLANPGPYTVLVPNDAAFAKVQGALSDPSKPENRAELTRVLTLHILPGTVLAEDLGKAVDNGKGKALVQTMGGETLTATKDGGKIILTDGTGGKATIVEADQKRSNGVVQVVDAVLTPSSQGAPKK
jgi:uncharacterized surface protein with fasciclin (FAS1) repeats